MIDNAKQLDEIHKACMLVNHVFVPGDVITLLDERLAPLTLYAQPYPMIIEGTNVKMHSLQGDEICVVLNTWGSHKEMVFILTNTGNFGWVSTILMKSA